MRIRHLLAALALTLSAAACGGGAEKRCTEVVENLFGPHLKMHEANKTPLGDKLAKQLRSEMKQQIAYCIEKGGPTDEELECMKDRHGLTGLDCLVR